MRFLDLPIKRKVMSVIMLTSISVLLLTVVAFMIYDLVTFRQTMIRNLSTTAAIIADESTAALAFDDEHVAREILAALRSEPHVVGAALYDNQGNLFVRYPTNRVASAFPQAPEADGHRFEHQYLVFFQPVVQEGRRQGTLFLKTDLTGLYERLRLYAIIALAILLGSVLVALAISNALQRRITQPILALAEAAKLVSERKDFSVRTPKASNDELGLLTDAFNQMLIRIQETEEIRSFLVAIVNSSDDSIIGKDVLGKVLSWNIGAEQMFGYTAAEMVGQPITRIQSPDQPELENQILQEAKRGRTRHYETVRIRKDGQPIDVSLTISPIKNALGEIIGISSISRDITERKQAEEQIRRLNAGLELRVQERTAELTAANRELEAFTYSVAHDLRAPLRHIDAFSKILLEDFASALPPEAQGYLENIRKGSRNMSQLVDDLLNLARVGRLELKRRPTPLDAVVRDVLAELKNEVEGRQIDWQLEPLPTVQCDAGLIKQVFANLLSNAVKYTRPRSPAIIQVGSHNTNGDTTFFIRDNGVGFNMKYADKLFGVFQRLHRAEEFEGTGVGLATVERIIRKHGGSVWAEGAVGQGATFYFTLGTTKTQGSSA
jgi:PAS domain S-box-containing protein